MKTLLLLLSALASLASAQVRLISLGHPGNYTFSGAAINGAEDSTTTVWYQDRAATLNDYIFRVTSVDGTLGANDIRTELLELIQAKPTVTVTYDDTADEIDLTPHNLADGDIVMFSAATALPAGLAAFTEYFVCNADADSIQLDNADATCMSLVTDYSGSSGTQALRHVLEVSTAVTTTPTGAALVEHTDFSTALARSRGYALMTHNANGTPATNNFTFARGLAAGGISSLAAVLHQQDTTTFSSTLGTSFSSVGQAYYRLAFADASFAGVPIAGVAAGSSVATDDRIYNDDEVGTRYTFAGDTNLEVLGVRMCMQRIGTPTAGPRYRIYTGANSSETLAGTTETITAGDTTVSVTFCPAMYFATPVTLTPGVVFRVVGSPTATGDASSAAYAPTVITIHDDAGSKALFQDAHLAWNNNGTWTYTTTKFVPVELLVADDGFQNISGGGATGFAYGP